MRWIARALLRMVVFAIVACSLSRVALAAEPDANPPVGDLQAGASLLDIVGGTIIVIILAVGFVVLSVKQSRPARACDESASTEPLPPDVVVAANPLRYLVMPVIVIALLAVGVPLGYSIWKSMSDTKTLLNPPKMQQESKGIPGLNAPPAVNLTNLKVTPLPVNPPLQIPQSQQRGAPASGRRGSEPPQL